MRLLFILMLKIVKVIHHKDIKYMRCRIITNSVFAVIKLKPNIGLNILTEIFIAIKIKIMDSVWLSAFDQSKYITKAVNCMLM